MTVRVLAVLSSALTMVAILAYVYWLGAQNARRAAKVEALEDFITTTERMNDEDADLSDADAVRLRLCEAAGLDPCPVLGDGG